MTQKRVAVIGMGAIGRSIIQDWSRQPPQAMILAAVCVRPEQAEKVATVVPGGIAILTSADGLSGAGIDVVVEAAGHEGLRAWGTGALLAGCDLLILSVGALTDANLRRDLVAASESHGGRIAFPSGALAGFDGLRALARAGLDTVTYTSVKPPRAWIGTPADDLFDLGGLTEATCIFRGTAGDAARLYPKNANLAAAVALAGIGLERTVVELLADPAATGNTARVDARGKGGRLRVEFAGESMADNPKTSAIVSPSALAALDKYSDLIRFA